ncbi:hypothetical protein APF79_13775 [bacterium BRH_c32]|nr:MAG: hypothetical protein APF79_13775 [bacterium BRH_c32]
MNNRFKENIKKKSSSDSIIDKIMINAIRLFSFIVIIIFILILGKIFYEGIGVINWNFLTGIPKSDISKGGIGPAIFGTMAVSLIMLILAVPVGIFSAIYINEFAKDTFWLRLIRASVNSLAGVPSIVIGLFGFGFFVLFVGKSIDSILQTGMFFGQPAIIWASATLAVLVLPTIIVTTTEALNSIPLTFRQASLGLGASKWQTIRYVILPQARPGILTGVILALSRSIGETAPIMFLGSAFFLPNLPLAYLDLSFIQIPIINPADQFMHLAYHIFILSTQSSNPTLTEPFQYGTTLVLVVITLLLNLTAIIFRFRFRKINEVVKRNQ